MENNATFAAAGFFLEVYASRHNGHEIDGPLVNSSVLKPFTLERFQRGSSIGHRITSISVGCAPDSAAEIPTNVPLCIHGNEYSHSVLRNVEYMRVWQY